MHVRVAHPGGEARFWLEPGVTLAGHTGLSQQELTAIEEASSATFRTTDQATAFLTAAITRSASKGLMT